MIWVKLVHLAAIAIWSAGIIGLPGLYVRRSGVGTKDDLHRLQSLVRHLYTFIVSPAAFIAVASGTALVFLREAWVPWFSVKLGLVGLMVGIHILTGLVIIRLFEHGRTYSLLRFASATTVSVTVVSLILIVVLAKPDIPDLLPQVISEPGGLNRLLEPFNPFRI